VSLSIGKHPEWKTLGDTTRWGGQRRILSVSWRRGHFAPAMNIYGVIQKLLAIVKDISPLPSLLMSLWSENKKRQKVTVQKGHKYNLGHTIFSIGTRQNQLGRKKGTSPKTSLAEDQGHFLEKANQDTRLGHSIAV